MGNRTWELSELVQYMRENRILRVKLGSLEVDLDPSSFPAPDPSPLPKPQGVLTEEEILFYSTEDYPTPEREKEIAP